MSSHLRVVSLAASLLLVGLEASAVTIDFEAYADPTVAATVVDSGATFTPVGGADFSISAFGQPTWGTAAPRILCPRLAGSGACESDFQVAFGSDVSNLRFYFTGDNDAALSLLVDVYRDGALLGSMASILSDGNPFTAHLVDLSSFGTLDRIVVNEPGDPAGFGYDDFTFDSAPVPEPGTMALLGGGLLALFGRRRRE